MLMIYDVNNTYKACYCYSTLYRLLLVVKSLIMISVSAQNTHELELNIRIIFTFKWILKPVGIVPVLHKFGEQLKLLI